MFVGETGVQRVVERTAAHMRDQKDVEPRSVGLIDLPMVQRYVNYWFSISLDLFGSEISSNAAQYFASGLKGRAHEDRYEDHVALEGGLDMLIAVFSTNLNTLHSATLVGGERNDYEAMATYMRSTFASHIAARHQTLFGTVGKACGIDTIVLVVAIGGDARARDAPCARGDVRCETGRGREEEFVLERTGEYDLRGREMGHGTGRFRRAATELLCLYQPEGARVVQGHHVLDHGDPIENLGSYYGLGRQRALVALGAEPLGALVLGRADGAHDLLGRAGEDIGAGRDVGVGGLGGQRGVAKGAGVADVDLDIRFGRRGAVDEAVDVQLGITGLNWPDHAQHA